MKTKLIFAGLLGALLLAVAGCVSTVNERTAPGVPFVKDRVEGRYERPVEQVFQASKDVVVQNGTLSTESTIHDQTNAARIVVGKVNQRNIWIRVQAIDPKVTAVIVQARTKGGAADLDLAHEVEKQIALKLVR